MKKRSILSEFPVYYKVAIFATVLASFYIMSIMAMEIYV